MKGTCISYHLLFISHVRALLHASNFLNETFPIRTARPELGAWDVVRIPSEIPNRATKLSSQFLKGGIMCAPMYSFASALEEKLSEPK